MTIGSILSVAASGLRARDTALAAIATNVAHGSNPGYRPLETGFGALPGGGVEATVSEGVGQGPDPARDLIGLVEQSIAFSANAAVFETGASLWDMLALIRRD